MDIEEHLSAVTGECDNGCFDRAMWAQGYGGQLGMCRDGVYHLKMSLLVFGYTEMPKT